MSIFATLAIVCTMSKCNDYILDHAETFNDGDRNTSVIYKEFDRVWQDEQGLNKWLGEYKINETVFEIVSIDFETREVNDHDIP